MEQQVLIKRPEVERITLLSRSAIYAAMDAGEFPRPVRIGRRAVALADGGHRGVVSEPSDRPAGGRSTCPSPAVNVTWPAWSRSSARSRVDPMDLAACDRLPGARGPQPEPERDRARRCRCWCTVTPDARRRRFWRP